MKMLIFVSMNAATLRTTNVVRRLDGAAKMCIIHVKVISSTQMRIVTCLATLMINATSPGVVPMGRDGALVINPFICCHRTFLTCTLQNKLSILTYANMIVIIQLSFILLLLGFTHSTSRLFFLSFI